jgi:hypothetical protein
MRMSSPQLRRFWKLVQLTLGNQQRKPLLACIGRLGILWCLLRHLMQTCPNGKEWIWRQRADVSCLIQKFCQDWKSTLRQVKRCAAMQVAERVSCASECILERHSLKAKKKPRRTASDCVHVISWE